MTLSNLWLRRLLAALVLMLLAGLWLSAHTLLGRAREAELNAANLQMEGKSAVYAEYARSVFAHLDSVLMDLRDRVGPDGKLPDQEIARHLKDLDGYSKQISIINADGLLAFSTLGSTQTNLSDREQFRFHRDSNPSDALYITRPMQGRISGQWTIFVTRSLRGPNGFAGVIQISLSPEVFSQFAKGLSAREDDVFALIRSTGEFMASSPDDGGMVGSSAKGSPMLAPDAAAVGTFFRLGVDGVPRFYAYNANRGYGVIAVAGRGETGVLGAFELRKRRIYVGAAIITALLLGMLAALWHALKQNDRIQAQLERAVQQAESANEEKSRFLATMSHELRTPLNGVVGLSQLLLETPLDPKQQEFAIGIARSGQSVVALVNDILDLSKIEAGRVDIHPRPFRMADCAEAILAMFSATAAAKGIGLGVVMQPGTDATFRGDATRIRQVLINLVGNALKFTEQGGVTLSVSRADADVVFEVIDTGVGVAPEARERIFERFTQADMSNARRYEGTGLGLAICRQLVQAMDGTIVCEGRTDGPGTVFRIRLPLPEVDPSAEATTQTSPSAAVSLQSPRTRSGPIDARLLVVEDNPVNQKVALLMLERLGYTADLATDGEAALACVAQRPYAVILMDVRMPDMDGLEVTRRIRAGGGPNAATPVIAFTANALEEERKDCHAAGMNDFLAKPLLLETLAERVAFWVRHGDGRDDERGDERGDGGRQRTIG